MKIFDSGIDLGPLLKFLESPHAARSDYRGDHGGDDADYDRRSCVFRSTCKGYRCWTKRSRYIVVSSWPDDVGITSLTTKDSKPWLCSVNLFDVNGEKVSMKHITRISSCRDDEIKVYVIFLVAALALNLDGEILRHQSSPQLVINGAIVSTHPYGH